MPSKKRGKKQMADLAPKALGRKDAAETDAVRGGRAGDKPVKYMEYKLKEVLISGV